MPLKSLKELFVKPVLNNMAAAVMALIMALALWIFAYNFSYAPPAIFSVPIHVPDSPEWTVSIDENDRQTVEVEVTYPRRFQSQVEQLFRSEGAVFVKVQPGDALNVGGGDTQDIKVSLKETDLAVSSTLGINVIRFHPSNITLHYVREMDKNLVVIPHPTDPPAGYQMAYPPYCIPRTIKVRGPTNIFSGATGIDTEPIDISAPVPGTNLSEWHMTPTVRLIPYVTVGGQRHAVTLSEETILCQITLVPAFVEKTIDKVPIMLLARPNYPYVASFLRDEESTISVSVRGPASTVGLLTADNIILFVNVNDLKPSETGYDTTAIEYDIVKVPNSGQLMITLGANNCTVKVVDPNSPK